MDVVKNGFLELSKANTGFDSELSKFIHKIAIAQYLYLQKTHKGGINIPLHIHLQTAGDAQNCIQNR